MKKVIFMSTCQDLIKNEDIRNVCIDSHMKIFALDLAIVIVFWIPTARALNNLHVIRSNNPQEGGVGTSYTFSNLHLNDSQAIQWQYSISDGSGTRYEGGFIWPNPHVVDEPMDISNPWQTVRLNNENPQLYNYHQHISNAYGII